MKRAEAEELKRKIDDGFYHQNDSGYPPYALTAWDDRKRFREYVFRVIDEQVEEANEAA